MNGILADAWQQDRKGILFVCPAGMRKVGANALKLLVRPWWRYPSSKPMIHFDRLGWNPPPRFLVHRAINKFSCVCPEILLVWKIGDYWRSLARLSIDDSSVAVTYVETFTDYRPYHLWADVHHSCCG
jgi:hypothetical protein